jgi:hypothetical protein
MQWYAGSPQKSTQLLRRIACIDPKNYFANYDGDKLIELAKIYAVHLSEYACFTLREQLDTFLVDVRSDEEFSRCNDLRNLAIKIVKLIYAHAIHWCITSLNLP